jgi:hypothetical protein
MKLSVWKIFSAFSVLSQWFEEATDVESEGGIAITANECVTLVGKLVKAVGLNVTVLDVQPEE